MVGVDAGHIKATYDKIISRRRESDSVRKECLHGGGAGRCPDPSTVMFKLKFPSASLLTTGSP